MSAPRTTESGVCTYCLCTYFSSIFHVFIFSHIFRYARRDFNFPIRRALLISSPAALLYALETSLAFRARVWRLDAKTLNNRTRKYAKLLVLPKQIAEDKAEYAEKKEKNA